MGIRRPTEQHPADAGFPDWMAWRLGLPMTTSFASSTFAEDQRAAFEMRHHLHPA